MTLDELIEKYLEPDPAKPWLAEYRVKNHGTHVWALIGHLNSVDWDVEETARDYYLTREQERQQSPSTSAIRITSKRVWLRTATPRPSEYAITLH